MRREPPPPYLLYAEDDPDDQEMFSDVMGSIQPEFSVILLDNGQEMMQYLSQIDSDSSLPCAIVLDINMPVKDGIMTLTEIKKTQRFSSIPVYILTNSANPRDKALAQQLGANAYHVKPSSTQELMKIGLQFIQSC